MTLTGGFVGAILCKKLSTSLSCCTCNFSNDVGDILEAGDWDSCRDQGAIEDIVSGHVVTMGVTGMLRLGMTAEVTTDEEDMIGCDGSIKIGRFCWSGIVAEVAKMDGFRANDGEIGVKTRQCRGESKGSGVAHLKCSSSFDIQDAAESVSSSEFGGTIDTSTGVIVQVTLEALRSFVLS